jgi:YidC/Oxa1 family membrane protein insertase
MADLPTSPKPPTQPAKEMSMEMRLLLAFVLMGLVLFITPYIYKPAPSPKATAPIKPSETTQLTQKPAEAVSEAAAAPTVSPETPGRLAADKEQTFDVDTTLYHVKFSNHGGNRRQLGLEEVQLSDQQERNATARTGQPGGCGEGAGAIFPMDERR